jgi:hypothetical protein
MVQRRRQQQRQQEDDERLFNDGQQRRRRLRIRKRTMTTSHFLLLTTVMYLECASAAAAAASGSSSSSSSPSTPPTRQPTHAPSSSSSSSLPAAAEETNPSILSSRLALEASIFAESALVDKESGRIYWEGGCRSTLSASLLPHLQRFGLGIPHTRSMVLTFFLLLAVLGALSSWLRIKLQEECAAGEMMLFHKHTLVSSSRNSYCSSIALYVVHRLLLGTPKLNKWFIATIIILYLVESYTCETHDYLRNAIQSPHGVEDYIERIRQEPPDVHWKVQSFHYVPTSPWDVMHRIFFRTRRRSPRGGKHDIQQAEELVDGKNVNDDTSAALYSPTKRKRVTERATGSYQYKHWQDKTIAGIWQRAQSAAYAASSSGGSNSGGTCDYPAPFAKIVLTKLLVLADKKTRLDYFQQQAAFVTKHVNQERHYHESSSSSSRTTAMLDEFAEFSTHINVAGFQPRLLAVRQPLSSPRLQGYYWQNAVNKIFRRHHFWLFTLLGLTLPYRIWFDRHCDELRVSVVKETSTVPISSSLYLTGGWFSGKVQGAASSIENFRELMERLQLYTKRDGAIGSSSSVAQQQQDGSVVEIEEALQAAALLKEKLISTQTLQPGGDGMLAAASGRRRKLRAGSTSSDENHDVNTMESKVGSSSTPP